MGIGYHWDGDLLELGICAVKGSRSQGFKGSSEYLKNLIKYLRINHSNPRTLEPLIPFYIFSAMRLAIAFLLPPSLKIPSR